MDSVANCNAAIPLFVCKNINKESIADIWNSKLSHSFRLNMLKGYQFASESCAKCQLMKLCNFSADNIDSEIERLKEFYSDRITEQ